MIATCGFMRPRSFTEDNAFHPYLAPATGAAEELGEALETRRALALALVLVWPWQLLLAWP